MVQKARRVGSRALVHVRGVKKVLEDVAAEKQPKDKVEILLGILEAMNEKTASQVAHRSR